METKRYSVDAHLEVGDKTFLGTREGKDYYSFDVIATIGGCVNHYNFIIHEEEKDGETIYVLDKMVDREKDNE